MSSQYILDTTRNSMYVTYSIPEYNIQLQALSCKAKLQYVTINRCLNISWIVQNGNVGWQCYCVKISLLNNVVIQINGCLTGYVRFYSNRAKERERVRERESEREANLLFGCMVGVLQHTQDNIGRFSLIKPLLIPANTIRG